MHNENDETPTYQAPRVESTESLQALLTWSPWDKKQSNGAGSGRGNSGGGHHS